MDSASSVTGTPVTQPINPSSSPPISLPAEYGADSPDSSNPPPTSSTSQITPHEREPIERFTTPQWTPGVPGLISPDAQPTLDPNNEHDLGLNLTADHDSPSSPDPDPAAAAGATTTTTTTTTTTIAAATTPAPLINPELELEKEQLIREQAEVEERLKLQLEAEAAAAAEIEEIKRRNRQIKEALNASLSKTPELKGKVKEEEEELQRIKEEEERVKNQNEELRKEIEAMSSKIKLEHEMYLEQQTKADAAKELAEQRAKELEAEREELRRQKAAFEEQKRQEEETRRQLENVSKMQAEELKQIKMHNAKLLDRSVKLQCWARQYFARQKVKARVWEIAMERHLRETSSVVVERIVRGFLGRRRVAFLLHEKYIALLNSTALSIQCWLRMCFARRKSERVKARFMALRLREIERQEELERLQAADEARKRDEERKEAQRQREEQLRRWEQEQVERNLSYVARRVVRSHLQKLSSKASSLISLRETVLCLRRFPEDLALQADGCEFVYRASAKSAPSCQFLLEEGVAEILQKAMETYDDETIQSSCKGMEKLLSVADDLKRAMPDAFRADLAKLKKAEGVVLPAYHDFWDGCFERANRLDEESVEEEESNQEDSFAAFESSVESPHQNSTSLDPFPNYSISPENSSFMRSIFEDKAKPQFDLSQRMKTPPIMPPPLQPTDIEEMKKSVKYKLMVEEEKKDSFEVYPSGAFTHTPYAIPLSKKNKNKSKKKKRSGVSEKKKKTTAAVAVAVTAEERQEVQQQEQQEQTQPEASITSVLTDPRAERSPEPDPLRPHTASGVTRQRPDPISRKDSANNEVLYYPEGEVMIVSDFHPAPDPIRRRDSANNEVLFHSEGEVMIVANDHGELDEVASKDLDPRTSPSPGSAGGIAFFDNNSKVSPPPSNAGSRPTTSPYQNLRGADEARSAAAGSRFTQDFKPWGNDNHNDNDNDNDNYNDVLMSARGGEVSKSAKLKPGSRGEKKRRSKRDKDKSLPKPPKTPPPLTMEEFQAKQLSPKAAAGPVAETLHKHSTVQKIFEAAAPPRQIVKNRYMGSIGASAGAGADASSSPKHGGGGGGGAQKGLGRRHSIRDMAAIFKILDDQDVGLIPAAKFSSALQAMSSLSVEKAEVETMLNDFGVDMTKDHIDYNEFLSTGTVLRIKKHTLNSTAVPFSPWKNQLVRPPPERSAHINVMWEKHVKWYQKRKEHAVLWLLKRAVAAQSYNKRQVKVRDFLIHRGRQALAWSELQLKAKIQLQHFTKQMRDAKDLRRLVNKARKHGVKQLMAHRGLCRMVRHDVIQRLIASHDQRNYNKIYYLGYKNKIAFEYLLEVGRHSVRHYLQQQEHVIWLHQFAERAKVHYLKCVENYEWLDSRSNRALKTWAKKDFECAKLVRTGNKYIRVWEHKKRALRDTHEWGVRAIKHCELVDEAIVYLGNRGQVALKYEERHSEATAFLLDWGYRAGHHTVVQEDSRAWLRKRVEEVQAIKRKQDDAQAFLLKAGKHAKRHVNSCEKARSFLATRVELSRQRQVRQAEARLDLNMFTDDARAILHKQALVQNCPGIIKETEKKIKVEDKEKDKARKGMPAQERFREEMKDAFMYFDTDDSGEIDKVEFRHLLSSGHLIHVPADEVDDSYAQIDKDGSGGVDFEEFFAWFQYEYSHDKQHGKMEDFRISKVIPLKQRATRLLLAKFVEGELEDDFGTKVPAPGQGVVTIDGIDDRWWLDEVEKQTEPFGFYLKRKEGLRILEEKRLQKAKEDAEEAARQKEANMTHEEKVARRKQQEADKALKVEEMKKRLAEKKKKNIEEQKKAMEEEEKGAEVDVEEDAR